MPEEKSGGLDVTDDSAQVRIDGDGVKLLLLDGKKSIPLTKQQAVRLASSLLSASLKISDNAEKAVIGSHSSEGAQGVIFGAGAVK